MYRVHDEEDEQARPMKRRPGISQELTSDDKDEDLARHALRERVVERSSRKISYRERIAVALRRLRDVIDEFLLPGQCIFLRLAFVRRRHNSVRLRTRSAQTTPTGKQMPREAATVQSPLRSTLLAHGPANNVYHSLRLLALNRPPPRMGKACVSAMNHHPSHQATRHAGQPPMQGASSIYEVRGLCAPSRRMRIPQGAFTPHTLIKQPSLPFALWHRLSLTRLRALAASTLPSSPYVMLVPKIGSRVTA